MERGVRGGLAIEGGGGVLKERKKEVRRERGTRLKRGSGEEGFELREAEL